MITPSTIQFLSDLRDNNTRDWFHAHKKRYDDARKELESLLLILIPGIAKMDPSIGLPETKDCIFRINRDIRFTNDKSPYKSNMGGFVARGGKKSRFPGYYVHIEPGGCFLAGGVYTPEPDALKLVRNEIYFNSEEFLKIITDNTFKKLFGELATFDKLIRPPKDFPADFPHIDLLKFKSYTIMHPLTNKKITSAGFPEYALSVFKAMQPLHAFISRAIEQE